jgi:hypothetical protein
MSSYQLQECLFNYLRALEDSSADGPKPELSTEGYSLTDEERQALENRDVAALYALGTHPVIINGYCRAMGYKRADYRPLFKETTTVTRGKARWQKS